MTTVVWTPGKMEIRIDGHRYWGTVRGVPGYGSWWTFWSDHDWPFYHGHYFQRGGYDTDDAMEHFVAWLP